VHDDESLLLHDDQCVCSLAIIANNICCLCACSLSVNVHVAVFVLDECVYGVATISRLLKNTGDICKIQSLL